MTDERMPQWKKVADDLRGEHVGNPNPMWDDVAAELRTGATVAITDISRQGIVTAMGRRGLNVRTRRQGSATIVWIP